MKKTISLISFLVIIGNLHAQLNKPLINLETSFLINASDSTPFWLYNNQYAKYSLPNSCALVDIKIEDFINSKEFFDYSYGLEVYTRYNSELKPVLHQFYGKIKIWEIILSGGKYEDNLNYSDSSLSMGHILWSKNARPFPKISISSNGYYTIPFTFDLLEVKGTYTHGWFNDDRYVDNVYLHHKNLYGRLGEKFPVNVFFGLEHFVQWGGISPDPQYGNLPKDFDAYLRVVKGQGGDASTVDSNEVINRLGNHIGSWNAGAEIKFEKYYGILYWQSIFDDNSGKKRRNFPDGLWGINIKCINNSLIIKSLLYEYLYTINQSGPVHDLDLKLYGNDNYFNNGIYRSGWTSEKMTIGTPFITSPQYNSDLTNLSLNNTRVIAHHFGLTGKYKNYNFRTLFSVSQNFGTYSVPFKPLKKQVSMLFEVSTKIESFYNIELKTSIGIDHGKMYGNNMGILVSLKKQLF